MATLKEVSDAVDSLQADLVSIDTKLDDVAAFIATLKAGAVDQAALDALAAKVGAAKEESAKVVAETDALKV